MAHQDRLEVDNLFSETGNLLTELFIFLAESLDLVLQVCKPLLLTLPTFQCSDPGDM